jgi:hypothetical protein
MEIQYSQLKINHLNDTPSTKAAGGGIFSGVFQQGHQGTSQGQEDFEFSWYVFFQQLYQLNYDTINFYVICVMALIPINSYFHHLNFYFFLPLPSLCSPMSPLVVLLVPFAGLPIFCCPLSNLFLNNRKLLP